MEILYDNFEHEYILESDKDDFSPPERYFRVFQSATYDVFTFTYDLKDNKRISVMYTVRDVDEGRASEVVTKTLHNHGVELSDVIRIVRWGVPKDVYNKILEELTNHADENADED